MYEPAAAGPTGATFNDDRVRGRKAAQDGHTDGHMPALILGQRR
jgi:hypothetical protein